MLLPLVLAKHKGFKQAAHQGAGQGNGQNSLPGLTAAKHLKDIDPRLANGPHDAPQTGQPGAELEPQGSGSQNGGGGTETQGRRDREGLEKGEGVGREHSFSIARFFVARHGWPTRARHGEGGRSGWKGCIYSSVSVSIIRALPTPAGNLAQMFS